MIIRPINLIDSMSPSLVKTHWMDMDVA